MITGFGFSDILRVEVNGLAVREAPSVTSPLAEGYRYDEATSTYVPVGDVRLAAGDFVSVELGPLPIGDAVWYLVWPAEDARLHYSPSGSWDIYGDFASGGGNDPGWVAGSVGDDQYLSLHQTTDPSEYEAWPAGGPMTLMVSGTGNYGSEPLVQHDLYSFNWAAAHDQPTPCPFTVTLVPDGGAEPVQAIGTPVDGLARGPMTGPASVLVTPWSASAGQPGDAPFTVSVQTSCASWSLKLAPLPHG